MRQPQRPHPSLPRKRGRVREGATLRTRWITRAAAACRRCFSRWRGKRARGPFCGPSARAVIAIESLGEMEGEAAPPLDRRSWADTLALGGDGGLDARIASFAPDDTACIIYTSGTGGVPKGVMLSHRNIIGNCRGAYRLLEMLGLGDDKFLSFLPLSHSYEHTAGLMFPISIGPEIYFAEGADTLATNLVEGRPTSRTAVPRRYEAMHQRIRLAVDRERGLKRRLFERAVRVGGKRLAGEAPVRCE